MKLIRMRNHFLRMAFVRSYRNLAAAPYVRGNSITFCSCIPDRTEIEHRSTKQGIRVMWIKDAAAGFGIVLFMVSAFVLASGASAFTV